MAPSGGGVASPALSPGYGNLPSSGAGSDGVLDSLELELLQMQRPVGVNELIWADLKQAAKEAARSVSLSGTGARDPGEGGRVTDFTVQPGSEPYLIRFSWTYRNDGDYDLDGRVRAADMALVGIWYGRTDSDPDWQRAKVADGNGDGRISIADASVIGINYGSQVDEYLLCTEYRDWNGDGVAQQADMAAIGIGLGDGTLQTFHVALRQSEASSAFLDAEAFTQAQDFNQLGPLVVTHRVNFSEGAITAPGQAPSFTLVVDELGVTGRKAFNEGSLTLQDLDLFGPVPTLDQRTFSVAPNLSGNDQQLPPSTTLPDGRVSWPSGPGGNLVLFTEPNWF